MTRNMPSAMRSRVESQQGRASESNRPAHPEPLLHPLTALLADERAKRRRLGGYGAVACVEGHPPYYFGSLEQWYSDVTIRKLISGIEECYHGMNELTARKYFDSWLRFMFVGGFYASQSHSEAQFFIKLNLGTADSLSLDKALMFVFRRIDDTDDFTIVNSSNDRTRATFWDGVRATCKLLVAVEVFPSFKFAGTVKTSSRTRTPVLADLSRRAGRLPSCASAQEYEIAIHKNNTELLALLRSRLEDVLIAGLSEFRDTVSLISDHTLPDVEQIDEYIESTSLFFARKLGGKGSRFRRGCALKLLWAICYHGYEAKCDTGRLEQFFIQSGKRVRLHRMLGANPDTLNAAYHIVAIDTGWSCQPIDDLGERPFVGKAVQGRKQLRSIGSIKVRAGEKEIEAPLADTAEQAWIPVRRSDVRISGVQVIEAWLEITGPLRERAAQLGFDEAASRLWIWREARTNRFSTNLRSLKVEWWIDFLRSLEDEPRLSGLPITRRIIRKTVANIAAMNGSFSHQLPMALLDHSKHVQSKMYLTEDTIRALYENKMREYLNLWEAVAVTNLDDAAIKLGIPEAELKRRKMLGLSSGLDFALLSPTEEGDAEQTSVSPETLVPEATLFTPHVEALENLHIARRALIRMQGEICAANPLRWIRTWLPWQAVVEAIATQLEQSRHRAAFRAAAASAERKLDAGSKTFPAIW